LELVSKSCCSLSNISCGPRFENSISSSIRLPPLTAKCCGFLAQMSSAAPLLLPAGEFKATLHPLQPHGVCIPACMDPSAHAHATDPCPRPALLRQGQSRVPVTGRADSWLCQHPMAQHSCSHSTKLHAVSWVGHWGCCWQHAWVVLALHGHGPAF
jgi:hypothetical protein